VALAAGGAAAVVLLGAGVVAVAGPRDGGRPAPVASGGTSGRARSRAFGRTSSSTSGGTSWSGEQALPDFAGPSSPVMGRITDRAAGISYDRLGGRWSKGKDVRELAKALGSATKTAMRVGSAEYLAAHLQAGFGASAERETAVAVVEEIVRSARYPSRRSLTPYTPEHLADGWMAGFRVGSPGGGWEVVVAAVVGTGVLAITVPSADQAVLPDVRPLLRSIRPVDVASRPPHRS
jgi:hypothetical protein